MLIKNLDKKQLIVCTIILFAALTRLLPHPPNFTPMTAIALFGGVYFTRKLNAYLTPILIMVLSDIFLGFYTISIFVYLSYLIIVYIGVRSKKISFLNIFSSSIIFFILSNLGVWLIGYPKSWNSLVECYVVAIPFFRNSIFGDFFFTILFVAFYEISKKALIRKAWIIRMFDTN